MNRIFYQECPVCSSKEIRKCLTVTDHSVSKEEFEIWECSSCTARFTQNIPPANEIGPYYQSDQYISHSDTKKGLVNKLYHIVRKRTLANKRSLIEKLTFKEKELLDIGAGTGSFAAEMQKAGWNVTGLEPDEAARKTALQHGIHLREAKDLYDLPQSSFNVITLWHVLEHVHDLHGYIKKCKALLRPEGSILIAVPNYTSFDAAHYGECWAAYDVPRHLYHFSPFAMNVLMQAHGLKIVETYPQWFDSFYVSMLSEKYKTGNSGLISGAINGLISNVHAYSKKEKCSSIIYRMVYSL